MTASFDPEWNHDQRARRTVSPNVGSRNGGRYEVFNVCRKPELLRGVAHFDDNASAGA
jgi:hypothetical protein